MQSQSTPTKAVIYTRVSDYKQTIDGDGLASQQVRCQDFAKHRQLEVEQVFQDDISGKHADRPGMRKMLIFLHDAKKKKQSYVVVIDDLSRLARDIEAYRALRRAIAEAGGILMSPSIRFGEDSDSVLIENLLASVAQHQREKNGEQTKNRMWARAKNGYWVFPAMPGYRFAKVRGHNKLLVRDEPKASIIKEALEGFATGRFETQSEVKAFLDDNPLYPKGKAGQVHYDRIKQILTHPIYAGYVDIPDWGVHMQLGKHEPLIDMHTFNRIQDRLAGRAKAPKRADIREDFPLRGFVSCSCCGEPYTAAWSQGSNKRYPYYLCDTKGCPEFRKSIPRAAVEDAFEELLGSIKPDPQMIVLAKAMFQDMWDQLHGVESSSAATLKAQLKRLENQSEKLMDRILDADDSLVANYEKRLTAMEREKASLREKIADFGKPVAQYDRVYRTAFQFLENPRKLWRSSHFDHRRAVLRMAFRTHLQYIRGKGYRTPKTTLPFKVLASLDEAKKEMVPRDGVEPPTLRFSDSDFCNKINGHCHGSADVHAYIDQRVTARVATKNHRDRVVAGTGFGRFCYIDAPYTIAA